MRELIIARVKELEGILVERERELEVAKTNRDRVAGALEDMRFMLEVDEAAQPEPAGDGKTPTGPVQPPGRLASLK